MLIDAVCTPVKSSIESKWIVDFETPNQFQQNDNKNNHPSSTIIQSKENDFLPSEELFTSHSESETNLDDDFISGGDEPMAQVLSASLPIDDKISSSLPVFPLPSSQSPFIIQQTEELAIDTDSSDVKSIPTPLSVGEALKKAQFTLKLDSEADLFSSPIVKATVTPLGKVPSIQTFGFATASGRKIEEPSKEAVKKARFMFSSQSNDIEVIPSIPLSPTVNNMKDSSHEIVGFATASGRKIEEPSKESVKKAKFIFNLHEEVSNNDKNQNQNSNNSDNDDENENFSDDYQHYKSPLSNKLMGKEAKGHEMNKKIKKLDKPNSKLNPNSKNLIDPKTTNSTIAPSPSFLTKKSFSKLFNLDRSDQLTKLVEMFDPEKSLNDHLVLGIENDILNMSFKSAEYFNIDGWDYNQAHKDLTCSFEANVSIEWVLNHFKQIVWKLCSYIRIAAFDFLPEETLTRDNIFNQLCYRHEVEINQCRRSFLKKLIEKDGTPVGAVNFFICDKNYPRIQISDGWYSIWAELDRPLIDLLNQRKLFIGQKLQIVNPNTSAPEAMSILEVNDSNCILKMSFNSTRRIRWYEKLGKTGSFSFSRPLTLIFPDGGLIPCIEICILKSLPVCYLIKYTDDTKVKINQKSYEEMIENSREEYQKTKDIKSTGKIMKILIMDAMTENKSIYFYTFYNAPENLSIKEGNYYRIFNSLPMLNRFGQLSFKSTRISTVAPLENNSLLTRSFDFSLNSFQDLYKPIVDVYCIIIYVNQGYIWALTAMELLICIQISLKVPLKEGEMKFFKNLRFSDYDSRLQIPIFIHDCTSEYSKIISKDLELHFDSFKIERLELINSCHLKIDRIFNARVAKS